MHIDRDMRLAPLAGTEERTLDIWYDWKDRDKWHDVWGHRSTRCLVGHFEP